MIMKKKDYQTPITIISVVSTEGGLCEIIEFGSPTDDLSNRRDSGYSEEGDEKWGDLWAEEEE